MSLLFTPQASWTRLKMDAKMYVSNYKSFRLMSKTVFFFSQLKIIINFYPKTTFENTVPKAMNKSLVSIVQFRKQLIRFKNKKIKIKKNNSRICLTAKQRNVRLTHQVGATSKSGRKKRCLFCHMWCLHFCWAASQQVDTLGRGALIFISGARALICSSFNPQPQFVAWHIGQG